MLTNKHGTYWFPSTIWGRNMKRPLELHHKTELMFLCPRHHYDVGIMTFTHDIHTVPIMEIPCLSASRGPYWIVIKSFAHNNQSAPPTPMGPPTVQREKNETSHKLCFSKRPQWHRQYRKRRRGRTFLFQPFSWRSSWVGWGEEIIWTTVSAFCCDIPFIGTDSSCQITPVTQKTVNHCLGSWLCTFRLL